jgi:adenine-specific DNA-methyltransferase
MRIQELETELQNIKKQKRYGLVWEDKPEAIVERCKNELPVLIEDESRRISEWWDAPTHILIEWDNYPALSVLAYTHEKSVDVIYIDPPYNTGNRDFSYNDTYVDREDSFRHSKWLSFMSKRLEIAKKLLKDTGVIFISIDDNEQAQLKVLCDEVFWNNHISTIVWQKKYAASNDSKGISSVHEYVLCYAKDNQKWFPSLLARPQELNEKYSNPDNDSRWLWNSTNLSVKTFSQANYYEIIWPTGKVFLPPPSRCWVVSKEKYQKLLADGRIWFWTKWDSRPYSKTFLSEVQQWIVPTSLWLHTDAGHNIWAKTEIRTIFEWKTDLFETPKPTKLLRRILQIASKKDSIVLDFFAWSGTTWHAVLELNREDGGKRQAILVTNNENQIAETVTYPRMQRVISGYGDVAGIPENLRYYQTEFIAVDRSIDDLRSRFIGRCSDMLCIRESCYVPCSLSWQMSSEYFRVFESTTQILAILYHPYEIEQLRGLLEMTHQPIVVYIFSMGSELFQEELARFGDRIRIETIPDEILQTYQKIFGF